MEQVNDDKNVDSRIKAKHEAARSKKRQSFLAPEIIVLHYYLVIQILGQAPFLLYKSYELVEMKMHFMRRSCVPNVLLRLRRTQR